MGYPNRIACCLKCDNDQALMSVQAAQFTLPLSIYDIDSHTFHSHLAQLNRQLLCVRAVAGSHEDSCGSVIARKQHLWRVQLVDHAMPSCQAQIHDCMEGCQQSRSGSSATCSCKSLHLDCTSFWWAVVYPCDAVEGKLV